MQTNTSKPARSCFTAAEWRIVEAHRTPRQVQSFLRKLKYNREEEVNSQRSFREVIRLKSAHCLEAAVTAAVILEQHDYPPLLLSFESVDKLDHVIFLFKAPSGWGAVARSRDEGLHGRKPIFKTPRQVAASYFDPYVDFTGRITGFAVVDLRELGGYDWRFSTRNIWKVENFLVDYPHESLEMSDRRYEKLLQQYKNFRAKYPDRQATYFANREVWM
ncbi:MAG: hypothetical protein K2W95_15025 [Candidatus Obscuribacterales bacterium]|nr:hypothetical protein [Candidatus Obscuribacterales bacterium]